MNPPRSARPVPSTAASSTSQLRSPAARFTWTCQEIGSTLRLRFEGELDAEMARIAEGGLSDPLSGLRLTVVLDMSGLSFIDTSGVSLILTMMRDLERRDGRFVISKPSAAVERVFDAGQLTPLFERVDEVPTELTPCPVCDEPVCPLAQRCVRCGSTIGGLRAD